MLQRVRDDQKKNPSPIWKGVFVFWEASMKLALA